MDDNKLNQTGLQGHKEENFVETRERRSICLVWGLGERKRGGGDVPRARPDGNTN